MVSLVAKFGPEHCQWAIDGLAEWGAGTQLMIALAQALHETHAQAIAQGELFQPPRGDAQAMPRL